MAQRKHIPIRDRLQSLFSNQFLQSLARETGAVQRRRKIKIVPLFWVLVLGFASARDRSLASLRRAYEKRTRAKIEESSFFNRFTPGLVKMLEAAVLHALETVSMGAGRSLRGTLGTFKDVFLTDGSLVRLHDCLARYYPSCRTNHSPAGLKMHLVYSVSGKGEQSVKVTNGRKHDGPILKIASWVKGSLLIFDLGYFRLRSFHKIDRLGGKFLTRLKGTTNPIIRTVLVPWSPDNRQFVKGRTLSAALTFMRNHGLTVLDAEAEFGDGSRYRVVALWNPETDSFHTYVTNVTFDVLSADQVRAVYALRWLIELVFKELKSIYRIEDLPSRKATVVKALFYAALLSLLISRHLLSEVRKLMGTIGDHVTELRWAIVFRSVATEVLLLACASSNIRWLERQLTEFLLHEAPDPNHRSRPSLLRAVESGTHAYRDRKRYA